MRCNSLKLAYNKWSKWPPGKDSDIFELSSPKNTFLKEFLLFDYRLPVQQVPVRAACFCFAVLGFQGHNVTAGFSYECWRSDRRSSQLCSNYLTCWAISLTPAWMSSEHWCLSSSFPYLFLSPQPTEMEARISCWLSMLPLSCTPASPWFECALLQVYYKYNPQIPTFGYLELGFLGST